MLRETQPQLHKKKETAPQKNNPVTPLPADIIAQVDREIQAKITEKNLRYTWLIPIMVVMVVAATIYLAVLERKTEYVYSLATACFGYYFGNFTATRIQTPQQKPEVMRGIDELTE